MSAPGRGTWAAVVAALALGAAAGGWILLRPHAPETEVRRIEKAWFDLRDAILQDDDEAFFRMHGARAQDTALGQLPTIRSWFLAAPGAERDSFLALYRVTEAEFLQGDPRALVVRMLPWRSGWRERKEIYRVARVKDIRIVPWKRPDGVQSRQGIVTLDISAAVERGEERRIPPNYMPTVVFIDEDGDWKRRAFFSEEGGAPFSDRVER